MRVNTKKPLSFFWPQSQLKMLHNSISSFIMFRCNKDGARGHRRTESMEGLESGNFGGEVYKLHTLQRPQLHKQQHSNWNFAPADRISFLFQRSIRSHINNELAQIVHLYSLTQRIRKLQCSSKKPQHTGKHLSFYF